jgi:hypothetical protein
MNTFYRRTDGRKLFVGAGFQDYNLLKARVNSGYSEYPASVFVGALYTHPVFPRTFLNSGATMNYLATKNRYLSAGCELDYHDFLFIRAGLYILKRDHDLAAAGIGVKKRLWNKYDLKADYSISFMDTGLSHLVQIGISIPSLQSAPIGQGADGNQVPDPIPITATTNRNGNTLDNAGTGQESPSNPASETYRTVTETNDLPAQLPQSAEEPPLIDRSALDQTNSKSDTPSPSKADFIENTDRTNTTESTSTNR